MSNYAKKLFLRYTIPEESYFGFITSTTVGGHCCHRFTVLLFGELSYVYTFGIPCLIVRRVNDSNIVQPFNGMFYSFAYEVA